MKKHALISRILPEEYTVEQVRQWSEFRNFLVSLGLSPIPCRGYADLEISDYGTFIMLGAKEVFLVGRPDKIINEWLSSHGFEVHLTGWPGIAHDLMFSANKNNFFWLGSNIYTMDDPLINAPYATLKLILERTDYFTRFLFIKDPSISHLDDCLLILPGQALVRKNSLMRESVELLQSFYKVTEVSEMNTDIFGCVAIDETAQSVILADSKLSFKSTILLNSLGITVNFVDVTSLKLPVKKLVRFFG